MPLSSSQLAAAAGRVVRVNAAGTDFEYLAPGAPLTAVTADAPAGGTGVAAGGWSSAANRNTAIALINNLKVRVGELEARLRAHGLLT